MIVALFCVIFSCISFEGNIIGSFEIKSILKEVIDSGDIDKINATINSSNVNNRFYFNINRSGKNVLGNAIAYTLFKENIDILNILISLGGDINSNVTVFDNSLEESQISIC
jgi:hypothetical protein